jgi:hypothetical protein
VRKLKLSLSRTQGVEPRSASYEFGDYPSRLAVRRTPRPIPSCILPLIKLRIFSIGRKENHRVMYGEFGRGESNLGL